MLLKLEMKIKINKYKLITIKVVLNLKRGEFTNINTYLEVIIPLAYIIIN